MADEFRRCLDSCGQGGVRCQCCNPEGRTKKGWWTRVVRARFKRLTKKIIKEEIEK